MGVKNGPKTISERLFIQNVGQLVTYITQLLSYTLSHECIRSQWRYQRSFENLPVLAIYVHYVVIYRKLQSGD